MTPEQQQQIRIAASLMAQNCLSLLGYPTVHNAFIVECMQSDLDKIKAVFYEIDARNSHDDSTAIPERKAA
jgi:hypothetical protein